MMNPIFPILIVLTGVILWFCLNSLFPKIGEIIGGIFEETKFNISQKENEEE